MRERAPRFQAPGREHSTPPARTNPPPGQALVPPGFTAGDPQERLAPQDTMTKDQAAEYAKVTPRTIARWIAQGALNRYTMQMNRVAVSRQELDRLLAARSTSTTQA